MSYPTYDLTLRQLQEQLLPWTKKNFGKTPAYRPLLGVVEEVGELCHAHLKSEQKIRGPVAEHEAKAKDAVGDALIYLADYCNKRGWDMQDVLETTWRSVRRRDWKKDPRSGGQK